MLEFIGNKSGWDLLFLVIQNLVVAYFIWLLFDKVGRRLFTF